MDNGLAVPERLPIIRRIGTTVHTARSSSTCMDILSEEKSSSNIRLKPWTKVRRGHSVIKPDLG